MWYSWIFLEELRQKRITAGRTLYVYLSVSFKKEDYDNMNNADDIKNLASHYTGASRILVLKALHKCVELSLKRLAQWAFKALNVLLRVELKFCFTFSWHRMLQTYLGARTCLQSNKARKQLSLVTAVWSPKIISTQTEMKNKETWTILSIYSSDLKMAHHKLNNNCGSFQ